MPEVIDMRPEVIQEVLKKLRRLLRTSQYDGLVSMEASGTVHISITFRQMPSTKALKNLDHKVSRIVKGRVARVSIAGEGPNGYSYISKV